MYIVIVNSHSGRKNFRKLPNYFNNKESSISFVPYYTSKYQEKDLWDQVKRFISLNKVAIQGVIIVGGDGTFHEAINQLHNFNVPFGLIPTGSANDFAKALKIPLNQKKALHRITSGLPSSYDLLMVNHKRVLSVAGMGIDAETAIKTNSSSLKKWLNRIYLSKLTYLLTFFTLIRQYHPFKAELTFQDGSKKFFDRVWLLAIGNTVYYGGGIPICPSANPQDGLTEVIIVHRLSVITLLLVLPTVFLRLHTFLPYVTKIQSSSFSVKTEHPVLVQGDGEKIGHTPQKISVQSDAIKIF
ncbi:diacylglycerol/lipid kinase family protein [Salipaludibacillus sp. HK11]|uniref:diacylglycerol/lipid kinase family protein n=1 Tax=Salipaludibacillus sp. HK11 TaxID=3394320 RepID=UPI0039FC5CAA